jgi:hypothetical protein
MEVEQSCMVWERLWTRYCLAAEMMRTANESTLAPGPLAAAPRYI